MLIVFVIACKTIGYNTLVTEMGKIECEADEHELGVEREK